MAEEEPIVAIALLTETNLRMLKGSLKKVFPVPQDDRFEAMLRALDGHAPSASSQAGAH